VGGAVGSGKFPVKPKTWRADRFEGRNRLPEVARDFRQLQLKKGEMTVNFSVFTRIHLGSTQTILRAAALAAAGLLGAHVVSAQGAAPGSKVGVISIRQAIAGTGEGKQAGAELQSQFAARQSELENMNKQISDVRQKLDAGGGKLSQEEQARLTRQGELLTRQMQRQPSRDTRRRKVARCPG